jgi:EAL domain-containing protein (putative c-di-GMP-specific phosphodiesterase class I)
MPEEADAAPLRLLLVGRDAALHREVAAAGAMLGAALEISPDLDAAIARLIAPDAIFSHVLASASLAPAETDALAGMVDEVTSTPTRLLLLGAAEDRGPTEVAVPVAKAAGILAAVRGTTRATKPADAELTAEEVRVSLETGNLRMRFQPVVDAATFRPLALEALARLHHPVLGILRPLDFMPIAIASGQEGTLTGAAAARTLQDLRPLSGLGGLYFAFNTPLTMLLLDGAAERAAEMCAQAGLPASLLVVEVLETLTMPDYRELAFAMERWSGAGFNLTIDDAGPRLPHWRELMDLPFTGVKLDGSLAEDTPEAARLADEITRLARQRGQYVIAEGVENRAAATRLRGLGVDALQGFYFGRPLPARAVPLWLAAQKGQGSALDPLGPEAPDPIH